MSLSTDVNLPRSHEARFPNRCVMCGQIAPDSRVTVITGTLGWWTWLLWMFGKPFIVRPPACTWCGWRLHLLRLISLTVIVGLAIVSLTYIWPLLENFVPDTFRRAAMFAVCMTAMLPYLVFQIMFPRPFDVTAFKESVDYEFSSAEDAIAFAIRNVTAEWVLVEGRDLSDILETCPNEEEE